MKTFKAGVVGTGFIGVAHVEALRRLGNVEVLAITDSQSPEIKAKTMNIPNSFTDYKKMIDTLDLDAVHICTPNNTHHEIAMYAMKKGINVICEKPMTKTLDEAKDMYEYSKKHNIVNAVNFHNRFNPMVHQLKRMVAHGDLGEIFSIHGAYIQDWLLLDTDFNWRINSKESGKTRAVADIGSHWIDTIEYVTNLKVTEVFAEFLTYHKTRKKILNPVETFSTINLADSKYDEVKIDTEDIAMIMLRFDNGAIGNAFISQMFSGRKNKISIFIGGSKQSAEWDSERLNELIIGERDSYNKLFDKDPAILNPETQSIVNYPGGHVEGFPDTFKQCFKQVYNSIETNNNNLNDFATFKDGYRQMLLEEKIFESAHNKKWIKI
ncbi:MAG: Gfo/Idh/MocA family oxidoreductase [Sebaldella sp.]|nr:Gfo/Idh/MocA family oxidoreductase [Sebaldella sp.]